MYSENGSSFFLDRFFPSLSVKIAQCPGMRSERCSVHNGGRRGNEKNPWRGWIASPWSHRFTVHLVRAFVRHLSYNLLRCCYITIHDTRDTRPHFVGTELSSLLLEGLPKVSFPITFLVILTIYIPVIYKRTKNKCSLHDLDLFLYVIYTYIIICSYISLSSFYYYCFLLLYSLNTIR